MSHVFEKETIHLRDGIRLAANVFRPQTGSAPTLLIRTPYGIDDLPWGGNGGAVPNLVSFLNAGYAVVWVSCRGTFGSEGTFTPIVNEDKDGFDTLEWVVAQPWSNGRIGMYGPSYTGVTQWAAAGTGHPALRAMAPMMTALDWYTGSTYHPGGAYSPTISVGWAAMVSASGEATAVQRGEGDPQRLAALGQAVLSGVRIADFSPVQRHPLLQDIPWFAEIVRHPGRDAYWQAQDLSPSVAEMTAPALFITGWYDFFANQQLRDFATYRSSGGSAAAREGSRLIVGPWDHFDLSMSAQFPDRDFGLAGAGPMADISGEHLRHFNRWLRDEVAAPSDEPRVKIFVMGVDEWREEADWPIPDASSTEFFLDDGALSRDMPSEARTMRYDYDPKNPVRSDRRERLSAPYEPMDCATDAERPDVLSFETDVLTAPVEIIGHVSASLFVASDALDTDFTVRLLDVFPDGRAIRLCDGITRMRYRNGLVVPQLLERDHVYEITMDVGATANTFLPGHRIRVDVSSSNFPRFDRNTNTGNEIPAERIEDSVVARNVLFTGPNRASRIVLPVIERVG